MECRRCLCSFGNSHIQKAFGKAESAIDRAANMKYDPSSYKTFMNPYIEEVINRNAANIGRQYDARRNDINQSFAEKRSAHLLKFLPTE
jgi:hypothetical protein